MIVVRVRITAFCAISSLIAATIAIEQADIDADVSTNDGQVVRIVRAFTCSAAVVIATEKTEFDSEIAGFAEFTAPILRGLGLFTLNVA